MSPDEARRHDPAGRLVLELAAALHRAGTPAHRLEGLCDAVSQQVGVEVRIFSVPTALFAAVGPTGHTELLRVAPGAPDLGRQADLDAIAEALLTGEIGVAEARTELSALDQTPPRWGAFATLIGFTLTGTTAAVVLGGGPPESAVSTVAGFVVGALALFVGPRPALGNLFEPIATFVAMALAVVVHHLLWPVDVVVVTLAAVIVLIPGLPLTTSIVELATRNLVSGTAR
ncbi:MAG: threonine/serine exporter family protein, partial [Myxococcota bacterium]